MDPHTESVRSKLKAMTPGERARLARDTEEEMRFPHHGDTQSGSDKDDQGELGGFLVSGVDGDHLPTTRDGEPDHQLMGAAWAALHEGYRGNKYAGPDKAAALEKLVSLYRRERLALPVQQSPARTKK